MVYYNPYYTSLFLWSLVWTLEVKNDKGLPLYPGLGEIRVKVVENIRLENSGSRYILLSYFLGNPLLMIGNKALTNLLLIFSWGNIC